MNVTAQMVNTLRQKTGVGMSKCKEALVACDGDQSKAEHWLRVQLPSHKPVAKLNGEGVIIIKLNETSTVASIVELTCETDFTAKSDRFVGAAKHIAGLPDSVSANPMIDELRMVFKESISLTLRESWKMEGGKLGAYVHSNGKLAVLLGCEAPESVVNDPKFGELLKDLAMHIAGTNPPPVSIDRAGLNQELIDAERKVIEDQFKADPNNAKKPENIKAKIVEGKLNRFYKERTLLEQPFVKDESKTVQQIIAEISPEIKVESFIRRQIG